MESRTRSPEALALVYLRLAFRWSRKKLAAVLGFASAKKYARYETGERPLGREQLEILIAPLGAPPEAVDLLLWVHDRIVPQPGDEAEGATPEDLTPAERRRVFRAALATVWALAEGILAELTRQKKARKVAALRREAETLAARLKAVSPEERRRLVELFPEFRGWAVVEKLSHDSAKAASHTVEKALELAELALYVAERVPGGPERRARATGYAWAFVANARRVATEFDSADQAFARAWELWQAGQTAASMPLAEWRLLDLEASLRREQHRFPDALERLDDALALCGTDAHAIGRILTNKANVLQETGDHARALEALKQAAPAVEAARDRDLLLRLRFNTASNLCYLERFAKAEMLLPEVRELAIEQGRELDLIRVLWLSSKVASGIGRAEEAEAGLKQVQRQFTTRDLPYEAALSSLDLAVLYLREGRAAEVGELALAIGWIFKAKGIEREALVALDLFCEAARQATVTVELAKQVIAEVERAQRSASPRKA